MMAPGYIMPDIMRIIPEIVNITFIYSIICCFLLAFLFLLVVFDSGNRFLAKLRVPRHR
jgi:hypothetical protein